MVNEKLKQEKEVEGCTFRPKLLTEKSMNRTANTSQSRLIQEQNIASPREPIHEKLYKSNFKNYEAYSQKKQEIETKGCTFNPSLQKSKRSYRNLKEKSLSRAELRVQQEMSKEKNFTPLKKTDQSEHRSVERSIGVKDL